MPEATMVEAINAALHQEMERDPRIVLFGQDVAVSGGVFRATEGLLEKFGGDSVAETRRNLEGYLDALPDVLSWARP